ncbi:DMT family transporter [Jeotgalibacillus soli]|uniref:EamA domain-containing protein n=1 Tax=Jeotgalibacillus soli TaxID=889306 RepID=A0A0C2RHN9_9BACL|nr:DMT family transporter [Jeotgalibacillus soli]KIL49695.1 hypothetical protein KP78_11630 [Jeotgalibacillus soli]
MKKYQTFAFLFLATLFWAGNYTFGKYVVEEMTPLQITFSRWLIAVFLLFPIAHFIERPDWKKVWKEWKVLTVMTLLGIIAYNFFLYQALQFTTPVNAALVNSINPGLIVLLSAFLLKEKITGSTMIGLLISLFGVLLVLTKGQLQQVFLMDYNQGDLLMLLAILVWAFYSIMGRRMQSIPPIAALSVSVLIGLIILLPFAILSGNPFPVSRQATLGILYMGIFPSVLSFIFWNSSLRQIGAGSAGVYLNLITVFTAVLSLLLGEVITTVQVLGGLLVFTGVYITSQKRIALKSLLSKSS